MNVLRKRTIVVLYAHVSLAACTVCFQTGDNFVILYVPALNKGSPHTSGINRLLYVLWLLVPGPSSQFLYYIGSDWQYLIEMAREPLLIQKHRT